MKDRKEFYYWFKKEIGKTRKKVRKLFYDSLHPKPEEVGK